MVLCLRSPVILYSFCYDFFPTPETFIFFNNQDTLSPDGTGQFCSSLNFQMRRMSMGGAVDISRRSSCEAMGCEGYIHGRLPKRRSMARFLLETGESNKSFLPPKNSNEIFGRSVVLLLVGCFPTTLFGGVFHAHGAFTFVVSVLKRFCMRCFFFDWSFAPVF